MDRTIQLAWAAFSYALVLAIVILATLPAAGRAATACPDARVRPSPEAVSLDRVEASIHCMVNRERVERRLKPLRFNPALQAAAKYHSAQMRDYHFFAHESRDGTTMVDRIVGTGYTLGARSWLVGENIAWGTFPTVRSLFIAWMRSSYHRANILNPRFRELGVGAEFGRPFNGRGPTAVLATTDFGFADRGGGRAGGAKRTTRGK